jgi:hypothetical protein
MGAGCPARLSSRVRPTSSPIPSQVKATIDVHIHYSFEPEHAGSQVTRWLVLDITMPILFRPLRRLIIKSFDDENVRTMAAVKTYAEAHPDGIPAIQPEN